MLQYTSALPYNNDTYYKLKSLDNLEEFRAREIKNLQTLKLVLIVVPTVINFAVMSFLFYLEYASYHRHTAVFERSQSFFGYAGPLLIKIQILLLLLIIPAFFIIHNTFSITISAIERLDDKYLSLYKTYTESVMRFWSSIPQFIISQDGLVIIHLFKYMILPPNSISKIEIVATHAKAGSYQCYVRFYQESKFTTAIMYYARKPRAIDFLTKHIFAINPNVKINALP